MKSISKTLTFVFVLYAFTSFSQETDSTKIAAKKPKHEVRIIMENLFQRPSIVQYYYYPVYPNDNYSSTYQKLNEQYIYGLGYNYNWNKIGLRTRISLSSYKDTYNTNEISNVDTEGSMMRISLGVNYQKHLDKIVFFTGVDFSIVGMDYFIKNTNIQLNGDIYENSEDYSIGAIGIEPLCGFKFFLTQHFSFSSEIRLVLDSYEGDLEVISYDSNSNNTTQYTSDIEGNLNYLGPRGTISFNVHF